MRILIAEDEPELAAALEAMLKREHYSVDVVHDGDDALDYGLAENYDGLVLDIMMPRRDGLEVLRLLREKGVSTPVLLLTARSRVDDRIRGLNAGADDYLPKPFAMGELLARVRAMLRRREAYTPDVLSFGDLTLDRRSNELSAAGGAVTLTRLEYRMMEALMLNRGIYLSTEELLVKTWGDESEAEQGAVWVYVSTLRKRLGAVGSGVRIQARRGVGYRLEAPDA